MTPRHQALIINHMVKRRSVPLDRDRLDRTFAALADPTRRAIMNTLAGGPRTVGALAQPMPISLVAVSKHIGVLERAGLVSRTRQGRSHVCRLHPGALREASSWLESHQQFWTTQLDALVSFVDSGEAGAPHHPTEESR